jgi:hypothetical protein
MVSSSSCVRFQTQLFTQSLRRLDHKLAPLAVQRDLAIADLAEEEHRLAWGLVDCERQLVLRELRLDRLAHHVLGTEEAVGGHQSVEGLVRTKMVVMGDEVSHALTRVGEVLRPHPVPELGADRLPQALDLAQGLGMVRARDHVIDVFAGEQLLEFASAAPGEVLASLIGQDLFGLAETRDTIEQGLGHEIARLARAERVAHDVAAVIVQEHGQVHALVMACEEKARDVALPELARS